MLACRAYLSKFDILKKGAKKQDEFYYAYHTTIICNFSHSYSPENDSLHLNQISVQDIAASANISIAFHREKCDF